MFYLEYNEHNTTEYGVAVSTRPSVPVATPRGEFIDIAGRSGSLLVTDDTFDDIQIDVELNFVRAEKYWWNTQRIVKNWITGSGVLRFSDDSDWFYKVKQAYINSSKRTTKMGNVLVASFICEPFQYLDGGQTFLDVQQVINNPYYDAQPIYKITGNGNFTLTVNDNEFVGDITTTSYIDTNLMIAYDENNQNISANLAGDYESLHLKNGINSISISNGFALEIQPNWRSL